jgi:hypothetical protein
MAAAGGVLFFIYCHYIQGEMVWGGWTLSINGSGKKYRPLLLLEVIAKFCSLRPVCGFSGRSKKKHAELSRRCAFGVSVIISTLLILFKNLLNTVT